LNSATFSKDLLAIFMLWFCPAFWWRDSNIHSVFSVFTSRPISFLASIKDTLCQNADLSYVKADGTVFADML
jgi:hypothetical protein